MRLQKKESPPPERDAEKDETEGVLGKRCRSQPGRGPKREKPWGRRSG